jgi:hypothetical protein
MALSRCNSWRFLVTSINGHGLSVLDHLATDRSVTPHLNEALEVGASVPSDSPSVNGLYGDGFPLVAEGVRQLYCFRRESDVAPFYTIRASTLILQVDDAAASDDARTRITSWDPWMYMFSRPVLQSSNADGGPNPPQKPYQDGDLLGPKGLTYGSTQTAENIIQDVFNTTVDFADPGTPVSAQFCFIRALVTHGTFDSFSEGYNIAQGTTLGQALQDMCATGYMDIVLKPIYDPSAFPGFLCDLHMYSQSNGGQGAGSVNYNAIFAWDRPGRSAVGMDNLYDGTGRANHIQFYWGQGGPPVAPQIDVKSNAAYGEYWAQQFFPSEKLAAPVRALASQQLGLRANFKQTLTVNPATGRAPDPLTDYELGDFVPVYASDRLRQPLPPDPLGPSPDFTDPILAWQRIYGIPIEIDDNGAELVRQLIVGPVGGAPVIGAPPVGNGPQTRPWAAIASQRRARLYQGSVQAPRNGF